MQFFRYIKSINAKHSRRNQASSPVASLCCYTQSCMNYCPLRRFELASLITWQAAILVHTYQHAMIANYTIITDTTPTFISATECRKRIAIITIRYGLLAKRSG